MGPAVRVAAEDARKQIIDVSALILELPIDQLDIEDGALVDKKSGKHFAIKDVFRDLGSFTIVGRGVAIENFCTIGRYVKLETNVYITAYSELEDRVFVAPCAATSNDNFVGRTEERFKHFKGVVIRKGGRVGVNATVLPGKVVHEDALVAAGAVLTKDAPPETIMVGAPAKEFRKVPAEQLLKNQGWDE